MPQPLGVACKAIIIRDGKLLLLRRSHCSSFDAGLWELPGGSLTFGESLEEALRREVLEEIGFAVRVGRPLVTWHFLREPYWITGVTFLCESDSGSVKLSDEHIDSVWIDARESVTYHLGTSVAEQIESFSKLVAGPTCCQGET